MCGSVGRKKCLPAVASFVVSAARDSPSLDIHFVFCFAAFKSCAIDRRIAGVEVNVLALCAMGVSVGAADCIQQRVLIDSRGHFPPNNHGQFFKRISVPLACPLAASGVSNSGHPLPF